MSGLIGTRAASRYSYKRLDTDANAFITAAAITDRAQKAVANYYVRSFKFYNLWTKCVAVYPFLGGTAAAHKFNLKNPADSNAAFRLIFNGTITHDNTGFVPLFSSGYADTLISASSLTLNDVHFALHGHNNGSLVAATNLPEMGASAGATSRLTMALRSASLYIFDSYNTTTGRVSGTNNSSAGVFAIGMRTASTLSSYYQSDMLSPNLAPSGLLFIGAINTAGGTQPAATVMINATSATTITDKQRTYTFASVGSGLTLTEEKFLYNIVWYAQKALRRMGS